MVPPNATHVVWEFSINDADNVYGRDSVRNACKNYKFPPKQAATCAETQENDLEAVMNHFRAFTDVVQQHPNKPELIVVFMWDPTFRTYRMKDESQKATWLNRVAGTHTPKCCVCELLRPLLKRQHVIDVGRDWVKAQNLRDDAAGITPKKLGDFVNDVHHMNARGHHFVAEKLISIIAHEKNARPEFRPLVAVDPASGDERRMKFDLESSTLVFRGHVVRRPMRSVSLLYDEPHFVTGREVPFEIKTKSEHFGRAAANRIDRIIATSIPLCNGVERSTSLILVVEMNKREQLAGVDIGVHGVPIPGRFPSNRLRVSWVAKHST